jgi:hypothetical protein
MNDNGCVAKSDTIDCKGTWSDCTTECERTFTQKQSHRVMGIDCPVADECQPGDGLCVESCVEGIISATFIDNVNKEHLNVIPLKIPDEDILVFQVHVGGWYKLVATDKTGKRLETRHTSTKLTESTIKTAWAAANKHKNPGYNVKDVKFCDGFPILHCEGIWSACTSACETADQRFFIQTQLANENGYHCPMTVDCEVGVDECMTGYKKDTGLKWCDGGDGEASNYDVGNIWSNGLYRELEFCPKIGSMSKNEALSSSIKHCDDNSMCAGFTFNYDSGVVCFRTNVDQKVTGGTAECYEKIGTCAQVDKIVCGSNTNSWMCDPKNNNADMSGFYLTNCPASCFNAGYDHGQCSLDTDCEGTWSACTTECELVEERTFTQTKAQSGMGIACPVVDDCQPGVGLCVAEPTSSPTDAPTDEPIDGGWTVHGSCSEGCGPVYDLYRKCDNPAPQNGGKNCEGGQFLKCPYVPPCDCEGTWSACTTMCEMADERIWTETQAQSEDGKDCPAAVDCEQWECAEAEIARETTFAMSLMVSNIKKAECENVQEAIDESIASQLQTSPEKVSVATDGSGVCTSTRLRRALESGSQKFKMEATVSEENSDQVKATLSSDNFQMSVKSAVLASVPSASVGEFTVADNVNEESLPPCCSGESLGSIMGTPCAKLTADNCSGYVTSPNGGLYYCFVNSNGVCDSSPDKPCKTAPDECTKEPETTSVVYPDPCTNTDGSASLDTDCMCGMYVCNSGLFCALNERGCQETPGYCYKMSKSDTTKYTDLVGKCKHFESIGGYYYKTKCTAECDAILPTAEPCVAEDIKVKDDEECCEPLVKMPGDNAFSSMNWCRVCPEERITINGDPSKCCPKGTEVNTQDQCVEPAPTCVESGRVEDEEECCTPLVKIPGDGFLAKFKWCKECPPERITINGDPSTCCPKGTEVNTQDQCVEPAPTCVESGRVEDDEECCTPLVKIPGDGILSQFKWCKECPPERITINGDPSTCCPKGTEVNTQDQCVEPAPECDGDLVWNECGTACPKICGEDHPIRCTRQCKKECQCPNNMWRDGDKCVAECPVIELPEPTPKPTEMQPTCKAMKKNAQCKSTADCCSDTLVCRKKNKKAKKRCLDKKKKKVKFSQKIKGLKKKNARVRKLRLKNHPQKNYAFPAISVKSKLVPEVYATRECREES